MEETMEVEVDGDSSDYSRSRSPTVNEDDSSMDKVSGSPKINENKGITDTDKVSGSPTVNENESTSTTDKATPGAPSNTNITPLKLMKFSENGGVTPTQITPTSASKKRKRLTPDERIFREKERTEKRLKFEEEKQRREEDKRRKEQERLDKLKVKEEERIERERQKELERLKREEVKEQERIKREEDIAKKAEEKRKKEEERLKKEEEKRLKEEERRVKEEERKKQLDEKEKERLKLEEKKAKQAQHFTKFFQKSPATVNKIRTLGGGEQQPNQTARQKAADMDSDDKENKVVVSENEEPFDDESDLQVVMIKKAEAPFFSPMPFQIKTHMAVAPIVRREPLAVEERTVLDKCFESMGSSTYGEMGSMGGKSDFVESIKIRKPRRSGRTKVEYDEQEQDLDNPVLIEDVVDVQPNNTNRQYRWKLVQFHDNRRPAYWGTCIRKPLKITGRRPFAKETELDYEFDSDDEWEDEPEDAEEIENSDGEEEPLDQADGEPVDEDDEEGWMVPHGYLSDTEREGEHMDLEIVKNKEKEFYKSLKEQVKMGLPVIETESLYEFRMILLPIIRSRIRKSGRTPKPPSKDFAGQSKGFLALDLPSDDEEDREWDDASSNENEDGDSGGEDNSDGSNSSDSDSDDSGSEGDDEEDLDDDECMREGDSVKVDKDHSVVEENETESMEEDEESVAVDTHA